MPKGVPLDPPVDPKTYHREYYLANKEKYKETPEMRERRRAARQTPEYKAYRAEYYRKNFERDREKRDANARSWQRRNAILVKDRNLRREFGITLDEWNALHAAQGLKCAICRRDGCKWHTDHCHETGKVRGILCHWCNLLLGNAQDRTDVLEQAVRYLIASRQQ